MRARILNASAGSGKTYRLAYQYIHDIIAEPLRFSHILAVTFTNKATEEMKSRILKEINTLAQYRSDEPSASAHRESSYLETLCRDLNLDAATVCRRAREARSRILHDYSRFTVLTIDRFFQRILRAFIKELGIDLNYNVEIETASVLTKSADELIDAITTDKELQRWLADFVEERIDEGAKWDIRDGILSLGNELFKESNKQALAAAGSKKTLRELVDTATARSKAARETWRRTARRAMEIMERAGIAPSDFSGRSKSFALYFQAIASGETKAPTRTVRERSLSTEKWCAKDSPARSVVAELQPLLAALCETYDRNVRFWNTTELLRENYRSFALLSDLYAKVKQLCDRESMLLLSETKYILSKFIEGNDTPFIYEKIGNRFDRFMIDEFQDTSSREWANFLPLLRNAMAQTEETSVLLVGDIKQSIYRWRGGDWHILHSGAAEALGRTNVEIEPMQDNYRSLREVVGFNNRMIARVVRDDAAALRTQLDEAVAAGMLSAPSGRELGGMLESAYASHIQRACKRSRNEGCVRITTYDDEPPLIERIREILDKGFRPCDLLILVRSKTDGARVARMLLDFKYEELQRPDPRYRIDIMTQEALIIGNAPVCSFLTAVLRLTQHPEDSLSRAILNRRLHRDFDAPLGDDDREFLLALRLYPPEEAFERIVLFYGLTADTGETAYLQAYHEQIIGFTANRVADIPLFLKWWDEQGAAKSLGSGQSDTTIEIMTVHKAKGLEKKVVLIPYCNWDLDPQSNGMIRNVVWATPHGDPSIDPLGRFPVCCKKTMAESLFSEDYYRETVCSHIDNINLLYVALTRAVEALHIFVPRTKNRAHVGNLILRAIEHDQATAILADSTGSYRTTDTGEDFAFGTFTGPEPRTSERAREIERFTLTDYPTAVPDLRLRLPSDRYFDEGETEPAPRNTGIVLHRIFEEAVSIDDLSKRLEAMERNGALSGSESERMRIKVEEALSDPRIREWFCSDWDSVRNENEIIVPGDSKLRRPDRVMIRGDRAVVVDYKFGTKTAERYKRQIGEYIRLLREMGYTHTEGYLWYVRLGQIVPVDSE